MHELLEEEEFEDNYEPLIPNEDAIKGSSLFQDSLTGIYDSRSWLRILVGILMCLTIVLLPIGLCFIRKQRVEVTINLEGESYRSRGGTGIDDTTFQESEVLDVASDARMTLVLDAGKVVQREKTGEEVIKSTRNKKRIRELHELATELKSKIDRDIMPTIILPQLEP